MSVAPLTHMVRGIGTPVVLLNGGMMSAAAWEPVAVDLLARHTVVTCDFRGQLLSPGRAPRTLDGHADDVAALLDHLQTESVHIVGTSFGALVGLVLAMNRPERLRSLCVITATDRITPAMWEGAEVIRDACRRAAAGSGEGALVFDLLGPATFSDRFREQFAEHLAVRRAVFATLPPEWFAGVADLLDALDGVDFREQLSRVRCPVLVLAAGCDLTFPLEHSHELASGIPDARLEIVAGAAHGLVVEEPKRVAGSTLAFLREVEVRS